MRSRLNPVPIKIGLVVIVALEMMSADATASASWSVACTGKAMLRIFCASASALLKLRFQIVILFKPGRFWAYPSTSASLTEPAPRTNNSLLSVRASIRVPSSESATVLMLVNTALSKHVSNQNYRRQTANKLCANAQFLVSTSFSYILVWEILNPNRFI